MGGGATPTKDTKTVVVLGAAYGGARAAQILAAGIPEGWRIILVDRNSHANHVYVMPRYAVLPGHEYKAFIPYAKVFLVDPPKPEHIFLQAQVTSIRPNHITLSKAFPEFGFPTTTIPFDYAIYALGSHLPPPLDLWGSKKAESTVEYHGLKTESCAWFKEKQKIIEDAPTILVVGGGALGIQFATDIKSVYPSKKVTLLHSRQRLLPRFDEKMHEEIRSSCEDLGVELILGERLDLDSVEEGNAKVNTAGQKVVRTVTGREIAADLLLMCTGQAPNTNFLEAMDPATVNKSSGLARVLKTMQLSVVRTPPAPAPEPSDASLDAALQDLTLDTESPSGAAKPSTTADTDKLASAPADAVDLEATTPYPHIFAVGDAADAFGAIPAGHNAYAQAEVAAKNVIRLIKGAAGGDGSASEPLEQYVPHPPAIKVSLGLTRAVYQVGHNIGLKTDGVPDLQAAAIWPFFGIKVEKDEDMIP